MMVVKAKKIRHIIRRNAENCAGTGSPIWNARVVTATPSRPAVWEPVRTMHRPVMVHTMMVSMKVPVMVTRP